MPKKKNWGVGSVALLSLGLLTLLISTLTLAQTPGIPDASQRREDERNSGAPVNADAEKHVLEENDKDARKKIDRLYELVTELKAESDKTDSTKVLNLMLLKKADEIEKLAHDIKTRAKG